MNDLEIECRALAEKALSSARERGVTLGCAESCTGGLIASFLTAIPGSSDVFVGGVVSYWVEVKENVLGVDPGIIGEHGVVSEECAGAMAEGACRVLGCDLAVSTTGIAGPTGAEEGKPVGTVCYGLAFGGLVKTFMTRAGETRDGVRLLACKQALQSVIELLEK